MTPVPPDEMARFNRDMDTMILEVGFETDGDNLPTLYHRLRTANPAAAPLSLGQLKAWASPR